MRWTSAGTKTERVLAERLPDLASKALTFDVATEQGFALIELLKLHIFREENIIFPKANEYISKDEFEKMLKQFEAYQQYWNLFIPDVSRADI